MITSEELTDLHFTKTGLYFAFSLISTFMTLLHYELTKPSRMVFPNNNPNNVSVSQELTCPIL